MAKPKKTVKKTKKKSFKNSEKTGKNKAKNASVITGPDGTIRIDGKVVYTPPMGPI